MAPASAWLVAESRLSRTHKQDDPGTLDFAPTILANKSGSWLYDLIGMSLEIETASRRFGYPCAYARRLETAAEWQQPQQSLSRQRLDD